MADTTSDATAGDEVLERRKARRHPPRAMELNVTSLIDVLFMLMLFFLLASRFAGSEGVLESRPPKIGVGPSVTPIRIDIAESAPGQVTYTVDGRATTAKTLYADLMEIRRQRGGDGNGEVLVVPAKGVAYQHALQAFNDATRAKFAKVNWTSR